MDEVKVNELPIKYNNISLTDRVLLEDEDGTKTGLLSAIQLLIAKSTVFETYTDMINGIMDDSVYPGMLCTTMGYHEVNDLGGGHYYISTDITLINSKHVIDTVTKDETTIVIQLITGNNETLMVEQFGAYGNGKIDDTKAIKNAINSGYPIKFKKGSVYKLTESIKLKGDMYIDFNDATLAFNACDGFIVEENETSLGSITLKNFKVDATNALTTINIDKYVKNLAIDNFSIMNYTTKGIVIKQAGVCIITNGDIIPSNTALNPIAITYGMEDVAEPPTLNGVADISFFNIRIEKSYPAFSVLYSNNARIKLDNVLYTGDITKNQSNLLRANTINGIGTIVVENSIARNSKCVIYSNAPGKISLGHIDCIDCISLLDQIAKDSKVFIDEDIMMQSSKVLSGNDIDSIFTHIYGTLVMDANIVYTLDTHILMGNDDYYYTGTLIDKSYPVSGSTDNEHCGYIKSATSIAIKSPKNSIFTVKETDPIKDIHDVVGGLHNQLIYLKSKKLIEIKNSTTIQLTQNDHRRIFIGEGTTSELEEDYNIELQKIGEFSFSGSNAKKLVIYIRPLSNFKASLYAKFIDYSNIGYGDNTSLSMPIKIAAEENGTGEKIELPDQNMTNPEWNLIGTGNSESAIVKLGDIAICDADIITIQADCSSLSINNTFIGVATAEINPQNIYNTYAFYPNGIMLKKSESSLWVEM